MAKILPGDWKTGENAHWASRVTETLTVLERGLPKEVVVFHGVHWSRTENGLAGIGEVDFVVLSPAGSLLLIEQKSGWLNETEQGLVKRVRGRSITVRVQVDQTIARLRRRLEPLRLEAEPRISYLLFCPDYAVKSAGSAGLDAEHIVDSKARPRLCQRITELLARLDAGATDQRSVAAITPRLHRFFANELELVPDASALVGRANALYTRMSEGLQTWARRFHVEPFRLRVSATAGSGKTQLALAVIEQAVQEGRRVLYVCFNRPLADHIQAAAPAGAQVYSYHQWCQHRIRAAGDKIDFSRDGVFDWLTERSIELPILQAEQTDCLIIDEGQDFSAAWRDDLLRLVAPVQTAGPQTEAPVPTQVWWLEDQMQNLYARQPAAPPDWPLLSAMVNYRSPRSVVQYLNDHLMHDKLIQGAGPIQGQEIQFLAWTDQSSLESQTKHAITLALRAGFRREDIALLTMVGMARSGLLRQRALGPHRFKAFRGKYDLFGNPEYTDGDILIDTVYRFKGQSAPCVILTECDFESLDDLARRKLFVGMTRASMHLLVVCSERALQALQQVNADHPAAVPAGEATD
ncbi:MAG: ATP-binding domain-containing protein [Burkholderiaceae bacterium]